MSLSSYTEERLRDLFVQDLMDLAKQNGLLDDAGMQELDDIRERLILIKRKQEGQSHSWKQKFPSVAANCQEKTRPLVNILHEVQETFSLLQDEGDRDTPDPLSQILTQEKFLSESEGEQNLIAELGRRRQALSENESLVIVAGETNGGKSSLLNLLLGMDILPTDVLHCTYTICKIKYSPTFIIDTLDKSGVKRRHPCTGFEDAKKQLKGLVAEENMRLRQSGASVRETTLHLPSDILKSGVTLVDTPGIGEDEEMDSVTLSYVKSTHASGFVYVIKSDAAGGVQEDRLIDFLKAIRKTYESETMKESFDPAAAMFVCHRWDMIAEKERVKDYVTHNLEFVWPGFDPSQLSCFSTYEAKKHLTADSEFVTDSYFDLLCGLEALFARAVNGAIKSQYLWVRNIVQPASQHLQSLITHCTETNEELEKCFRHIATKQDNLMDAAKENSQKLKEDTNNHLRLLKLQIAELFNVDGLDLLTCLPNVEELKVFCSEDNFFVKKENRKMLKEKILKGLLLYVDDLVKSRNLVSNHETSILEAIENHLGLFKTQVRSIKRALVRGKLPNMDSVSSISLGESSSSYSSYSSSTTSSIDDFEDQIDPSMDPVALAHNVKSLLEKKKTQTAPIRVITYDKQVVRKSAFSHLKNKTGNLKDSFTYSNYSEHNRQDYIKKRLRKLGDSIRLDKDILNEIVDGYTEWIMKCVDSAVGSIPMFIAVNINIMGQIREHRQMFLRDKELLREVMERLEPLRNSLRGYGTLYMNDVNAHLLSLTFDRRKSCVTLPESIGVTTNPNDSGFEGSSSRRKVRGFWARLQSAEMREDNIPCKITIKTYTREMEERSMLTEIAALRCVSHASVSPFIGMARLRAVEVGSTRSYDAEEADVKVSAFIFRGDLVSVHMYAKDNSDNLSSWIPQMLTSLLDGLHYLHGERMRHMELNTNTVMVDRQSGNVKLCHMGTPRPALLPQHPGQVETGPCVCLSPAVLDGDEYACTDDIYAFGLLLWEMLFPDECKPFEQQRKWTLSTFIEKCHPRAMLADSLDKLPASKEVMAVLRGTLLVSRRQNHGQTLTIPAIQSLLKNLRSDQAVKLLSRQKQEFATNGPAPIPPPRKKKQTQTLQFSETDKRNDSSTTTVPRKGRRYSLPAICPPKNRDEPENNKNFEKTRKISGSFDFIKGFFNISKQKDKKECNKPEESSFLKLSTENTKGKRRVSIGATPPPEPQRPPRQSDSSYSTKLLVDTSERKRRVSIGAIPATEHIRRRRHSEVSQPADIPNFLSTLSSPLSGSPRFRSDSLRSSSSLLSLSTMQVADPDTYSLTDLDIGLGPNSKFSSSSGRGNKAILRSRNGSRSPQRLPLSSEPQLPSNPDVIPPKKPLGATWSPANSPALQRKQRLLSPCTEEALEQPTVSVVGNQITVIHSQKGNCKTENNVKECSSDLIDEDFKCQKEKAVDIDWGFDDVPTASNNDSDNSEGDEDFPSLQNLSSSRKSVSFKKKLVEEEPQLGSSVTRDSSDIYSNEQTASIDRRTELETHSENITESSPNHERLHVHHALSEIGEKSIKSSHFQAEDQNDTNSSVTIINRNKHEETASFNFSSDSPNLSFPLTSPNDSLSPDSVFSNFKDCVETSRGSCSSGYATVGSTGSSGSESLQISSSRCSAQRTHDEGEEDDDDDDDIIQQSFRGGVSDYDFTGEMQRQVTSKQSEMISKRVPPPPKINFDSFDEFGSDSESEFG